MTTIIVSVVWHPILGVILAMLVTIAVLLVARWVLSFIPFI